MNPHVFKGRSSPALHPKGSPANSRICPIALGKKTYHSDDKKFLKELDKFEYPSHYAPLYDDDGNIIIKGAKGLDNKLADSLADYHNDSLDIDWDNISKRKAKKLAKRGIYPPHPLNFNNDNN